MTIPIQPDFLKSNDLNDGSKAPKRQSAIKSGALDDAMAQKIIEIIRKQPDIKQDDIIRILAIPRRTLQRKMTELQNEGTIVREGGKRYGRWVVVGNNDDSE